MRKVSKEELIQQVIEAVNSDDFKGAKLLVGLLESLEKDYMEVPF